MKLDIDTYFNYKLIRKLLKEIDGNVSVIGLINRNPRLTCKRNYKWSITCYNSSKKYLSVPSYPYGPGFLFKYSSIDCINFYFSKHNKIIWIEDVFFGILMNYCNLKYLDITKSTDITYKQKNNISITKKNIFVHGLYPIEMLIASQIDNE